MNIKIKRSIQVKMIKSKTTIVVLGESNQILMMFDDGLVARSIFFSNRSSIDVH